MNNPLRDAFTVEMSHLIREDEVLQQDWTPGPHRQRGKLVAHWGPSTRRHRVRFLSTTKNASFSEPQKTHLSVNHKKHIFR